MQVPGGGPRPRVRARIVDPDLVLQGVVVAASEALHEVQEVGVGQPAVGEPEIVDELLRLGANIHSVNRNKNDALTPLQVSIVYYSIGAIRVLIRHCPELRTSRYHAIFFAMEDVASPPIVKFLIEEGFEANDPGEDGFSSLDLAFELEELNEKWQGIPKLLLDNGADPTLLTNGTLERLTQEQRDLLTYYTEERVKEPN